VAAMTRPAFLSLRHSSIVALAIATVGFGLCGPASAAPRAQSAAIARCGPKRSLDYLCRKVGGVSIIPPGSAKSRTVRSKAATLLAPQTTVRVAAPVGRISPFSLLTFARDAQCRVGGDPYDRPTELITRWEGSHTLFKQSQGQTFCDFRKGGRGVLFPCDRDPTCRIIATPNGSTRSVFRAFDQLVRVSGTRAHRSVAAQTAAEVVRITVCTGAIDVRVGSADNFSQVSGSSSTLDRVVIKIVQTSSSISIEMQSVYPTPECASHYFS
jgi:hypothetical protein